jgi:hypothetical protein
VHAPAHKQVHPPLHTLCSSTRTCTPTRKRMVPSLSFMGASVNMFQKGAPLRL